MPIPATMWTAQLTNNALMKGGRNGIPTDVNVVAVPIPLLKSFTISHNTFADAYYQPWNAWYHNGVPFVMSYPREYTLQNGEILTVDWDAVNSELVLTQI